MIFPYQYTNKKLTTQQMKTETPISQISYPITPIAYFFYNLFFSSFSLMLQLRLYKPKSNEIEQKQYLETLKKEFR